MKEKVISIAGLILTLVLMSIPFFIPQDYELARKIDLKAIEDTGTSSAGDVI